MWERAVSSSLGRVEVPKRKAGSNNGALRKVVVFRYLLGGGYTAKVFGYMYVIDGQSKVLKLAVECINDRLDSMPGLGQLWYIYLCCISSCP